MIFFLISQIAWGNSLCSSENKDIIQTTSVLQVYFDSKNCEEMMVKLKKVKSISIVDKGVQDISILKEAKKIEYLNLSNNEIKDTTALRSLDQIKWLDLSGNPIGTMKNLPTKSLETFWCVDCKIINWETMGKMAQLKHLSLRNNQLETIDLKQFPTLQSLLLSENQITDPSALSVKKKITVVELYGNPIEIDKCPKDKKVARGLRRACFSLFDKED